jgi:hypothetical protein
MKKITTIALLSLAVVTLLVQAHTSSLPAAARPEVYVANQGPSFSNCLAPPTVSSTVPKDMALTRQADANCFAWQEFLALNWVASSKMRGAPDTTVPASAFGNPNDRRPVVWETYKESDEVFLPNGKKPAPWNSWPTGSSLKVLGGMLSEVDPEPTLDLSDIGQASFGHPWLTAQNKYLTLYERRLNQDEFNYIVTNQLYIASKQTTLVQSSGLNLPDGTAATAQYGPLGAIETKAAWIQLDDPKDWPRYKTAKAVVSYPQSKPQTVVVGLVGLHIIHKTALGQQFIWATFEHVDNCPDRDQVANNKLAPSYTYYNPNCDPQTDRYKCVANANPKTAGSPPNPYNAPIQVVRQTPIPSRANDNVTGLNQAVWNVIRTANPKSVFLNYQLVNTLWSNQSTHISAGARTPLFAGQLSPGPSQEPVANTTLETYVQNLTCLACHASAPVASSKPAATTRIFDPAKAGTPATATNPYASDYSFLFNNAQDPKARKGNR